MLTPEVVERPAQPYVAIRAQVTMQTLGTILPPLMPQVFAWLGQRGIPPAGAPLWKYNVIDMDRLLEVEVGVPVAASVDGDDHSSRSAWPISRLSIPRSLSLARLIAVGDVERSD
jgi:hypothetical protein